MCDGRKLKQVGMIIINNLIPFFRLSVKEDFSEEVTANLRLDVTRRWLLVGIWGKGIPKGNRLALGWGTKGRSKAVIKSTRAMVTTDEVREVGKIQMIWGL